MSRHAKIEVEALEELREWLAIAAEGIHKGMDPDERGPSIGHVDGNEVLLAVNAIYKAADVLGSMIDEAVEDEPRPRGVLVDIPLGEEGSTQ